MKVCADVRYDESRKDDDVDWKDREEQFRSIVESAKKDRKKEMPHMTVLSQ